ncbi:MAG: CapA family protein [Hamadaea sp.]|nr:CapA family protein [Hamadaea sp.]
MATFLPFVRAVGGLLAAGLLLSSCAGTPKAAPGSAPTSTEPGRAAGRTTEKIAVLGAGDVLVHPQVWQQADRDGGFAPMFAGVGAAVSGADLALCHLETPLAAAGGPYLGWPRFSTPPGVLDGIRAAGYDGCSTASNHSFDQGERGILRTIAAMDAAGLGHAGTAARQADAGRARFYDVHGVRVAHLAATATFNGIRPPDGKAWLAQRIDPAALLAQARQARQAGADLVVVSLHWGTEYRHQPDRAQLDWARRLSGGEIDLVLGHHAHVVQPVRRIGKTWFAFGLGNQLARHADPRPETREGLMVRVTFARQAGRWGVERVEALPTWVEITPRIRLVDLRTALTDGALSAERRREYQAALERVLGYAELP